MSAFVIMATGQSLTAADVEKVRHLPVIAVSNAYELVPHAFAMVSQDRGWWRVHPEAMAFAGRKFCGHPGEGLEEVKPEGMISSGTNSGLLACHIAVTRFGATKLLLLGMDLHGTHYFGAHPAPLRNTQPSRFAQMHKQFEAWAKANPKIRVVNCSNSSALKCFPRMSLDEGLAELTADAA